MNLQRIIRLPELMESNTRIHELRRLINQHNYRYHTLGAPDISDSEFDGLMQELIVLEKQYPELDDSNSPTKRVGAVTTNSFVKVKHERRMLSLENTYTPAEVIEFFTPGDALFVEPKIDGLSLKLIYQNGKLKQAITRGNGDQGDDVTENARTIRTIPLELNEDVSVEVTGEVYMTYTVFNQLNSELEAQQEEPFANARNAAAGTLKLKNPQEVARRRLSFVAHGCITEIPGVDSQNYLVEYLESLGFQSTFMLPLIEGKSGVSCFYVPSDEAGVKEFLEQKDADRKRLDVATDGLVFKLNDLNKQRELGEGTRAPKWAVAFKYPPERKQTTLLGVTVQVGKTGRITPVAELQPIPLSGTIVRRASLCNQDEVERLGIDVGDIVYVEKSAEIIPKVVGVAREVRGSKHWKMPELCPSCATKLVRHEGEVDFYCPNYDCEEQVFGRLKHATGKSALDISGCGEAMVRELMRHGVRSLSSLLSIKDVTFLKPAARNKFREGRDRALRQVLWRKLHALGIDGLGQVHCQEIATHFLSFEAAFDDPARLKDILGDVVFNNLIAFVESNAEELDRLEQAGLKFETDKSSIGALTGKIFAITGTLVSGSRDAVMRRIEAAGGVVKSSVGKQCHYLVVGTDAGKNKTSAATKWGTQVINEQQLYALMGVEMPIAAAPDPYREF